MRLSQYLILDNLTRTVNQNVIQGIKLNYLSAVHGSQTYNFKNVEATNNTLRCGICFILFKRYLQSNIETVNFCLDVVSYCFILLYAHKFVFSYVLSP